MQLISLMSRGLAGLWLVGLMAAVHASSGPQPVIAPAPPIILEPLQSAEQSTAAAGLGGVLVITVRDEKRDRSKPPVKPSELKEALVVPSNRTKVEFHDTATEIRSDAASTDWAFTFTVSGMPAGLTLTRYVKFSLGQMTWQMPFAITSPGSEVITAPEKWSVKPWPTNGRALEPDEGMPLFIAVPAQAPRAALKVVSFDLVEQSTKKTTAWPGWQLCPPAAQTCDPIEFTKFGKGVHEVRLRPPVNENLDPGKYEGVLVVSSEGAPDGVVEIVSATLYATSVAARVLGFAAVVAGVLISTVGISFGRRWVDRKRLMIPAAVLQESVKNLAAELKKIAAKQHIDGARTEPFRNALGAVYGALSEQQLSKIGLPSSIPNPWVAIDTVQVEQLKSYIDAQAAIILRLQVIIQRGVVGVEALRERYGRLTAEAPEEAYKAAYEALGSLAKSTTLDSNAVAQRVDDIVDKFRRALESRVRGQEEALALFSARIADALPTPEHLRLRVKEGTFLVWALVVIITVGVGTHLLILSNPGFGTLADKLNCLFWGLGLGTGAAAMGINVSSVLTGFNITR